MDSQYYSNQGVCRLSYDLDNNGLHKLVGLVDKNLLVYFYSLIPKYYQVNRPMYAPHVSFIRKETPINLEHWGKYQNEECQFYYSSLIREDDVYLWIDVYCERAMAIRQELGLSFMRFMSFHITIANKKRKVGQ